MRQDYRWLLLDADNTLFDFDTAQDHVLDRLFLHFGLSPSKERKARYRMVNAALWRAFDRGEIRQKELMVERYARFLAEEGIDGDPTAWNEYGLRCLANTPFLLPGAQELCQSLSKRFILALVTNGVPFVQRGRLERSPLAGYFGRRVYISGELGCHKPERRFFELVLTDLGAAPERTLVIGDGLSSDIQGARNAGLDCVWLSRRDAAPGEPTPTYQVSDLPALACLLGGASETNIPLT